MIWSTKPTPRCPPPGHWICSSRPGQIRLRAFLSDRGDKNRISKAQIAETRNTDIAFFQNSASFRFSRTQFSSAHDLIIMFFCLVLAQLIHIFVFNMFFTSFPRNGLVFTWHTKLQRSSKKDFYT